MTFSDGVFCGPSAVFTNVLYPRAGIERRDEFAPLWSGGRDDRRQRHDRVRHDHRGVRDIAAGAVVTHAYPHYALMAGVPARRWGWVGAAGEPLGPDLTCPRTGQRYRLVAPEQLEEVVE